MVDVKSETNQATILFSGISVDDGLIKVSHFHPGYQYCKVAGIDRLLTRHGLREYRTSKFASRRSVDRQLRCCVSQRDTVIG